MPRTKEVNNDGHGKNWSGRKVRRRVGGEIIVVNTPLGGLHAMKAFSAALPNDFPLPLAVVQHWMTKNDKWVNDREEASNGPDF